MRPSDYELLNRTEFFAALGEAVIQRLTRGAFVQGLPKGAVLFSQGDEPEFIHVVLSGRVNLVAKGPDEEETVVEFFGPGEIFVAAAVVLKLPYLVSARVSRDARILMIPGETFRRALAQEHALAVAMVTTLSRHWRVLVTQIKDLKLRSASQRLASYILTLADVKDGPVSLELPESRRSLAARLGIAPESLSRGFAQLESLGVRVAGREVAIGDAGELRKFCGFEGTH
jgi:CRP/FNR family transcriptional regulator, transcriptional activator FtrB